MLKSTKSLFIFGVTLTSIMTAVIVAADYYVYKKSLKSFKEILQLNEKKNTIIYYDEVLTMSARMGAFTGQEKWSTRYNQFVPLLDEDINFVLNFAPKALSGSNPAATDKANQELIADEEKAFALVKNNKLKQAQDVLFSEKYQGNKKIYQSSMVNFQKELNGYINRGYKEVDNLEKTFFIIQISLLLFLGLIWLKIYQHFKKIKGDLASEKNEQEKATNQLILMGEISSGVAHDVINPLTVIQMQADRILKDYSKCSIERIEKIKKSTDLAIEIVNNLKQLSRNESADEKSEESLKMIVTDVLTYTDKRLKINAVHDIRENYPQDTVVYAKPAQLKQILINIIHNASDAIQKHDEKWIEINSFNMNGFQYISIKDSGPGIEPEIAKRLFESQFTTKEVGKGTGMGLSICKKLLETMGGDIEIDHSSKNTCFIIKLPIKTEIQLEDAAQRSA